LRPIARETISRRVITKGWDPLLRIAASVKSGWVSATYVIDRFASASRGDVAADAGDALGKLLRTLYLCDYLGNTSFRNQILNLLNQGESVHSLERAIHNGSIGAKRGRTTEQLAAISGALSLTANVVMGERLETGGITRRAPVAEHLRGSVRQCCRPPVQMRDCKYRIEPAARGQPLVATIASVAPCSSAD